MKPSKKTLENCFKNGKFHFTEKDSFEIQSIKHVKVKKQNINENET